MSSQRSDLERLGMRGETHDSRCQASEARSSAGAASSLSAVGEGCTWYLNHWLQQGSLVTAFEAMSRRAGIVERETADGYLAREIKVSGLILASFLDELHPDQVTTSTAVERLVRRLVVLEESISIDKKERAAFYEKKLAFMGIGGSPLPRLHPV